VSTLKRKKHYFFNISPNRNITSIAIVTIPLLLSAFTHVWNPIGSPDIHDDEGHYIRRALHVSEGLGAQEKEKGYDHPYFGWLFLGSMFNIVGYPDSLSPRPGDVSFIEVLWSAPRIFVGILAVVDTFLIYKIAETGYNRKVAFTAAILFAVMPSSWLMRSVFLETLQLPLILLSILFAMYYKKNYNYIFSNKNDRYYQSLTLSLSGIFLGLAIFTKIPAFTFIPLVAYLVFLRRRINSGEQSIQDKLRNMVIWLIPVILIPVLWPIHAISVDGFDNFIEGINFQLTRSSKPLFDAILLFFSTDPILLTLGMAGIAFCAAKREYLFLIWTVPFMLFLYFLNYVSYFFLFPLIPAFCIASAVMINDSVNAIFKQRKTIGDILLSAAVFVISVFGLVATTALVASEENSSYLEAAAVAMHHLPSGNPAENNGDTNQNMLDSGRNLTVVAGPGFYWIMQYVFDKHDYDYRTQYSLISTKTLNNILKGSEKVLMVADPGILEIVNNERMPDNERAKLRAERLSEIYNSTKLVVKLGNVEIRTNYN
jgi:Dolichyl-phosphate-mannose-protein mannosyltransferase